jgi:hypothetical protein
MAGKQIDFPPLQKEDPRVAKVMVGVSLVCIAIVAVLLLAGVEGPFLGPYGG